MGYRSDVGIVIPYEDEDALRADAKLLEVWDEILRDTTDILVKERDGKKYTIFYFTDYKWYLDYPVVRFFENWMTDHEYNIDFVRVGEDYDDIEVINHLDTGLIWPTTTIRIEA